MKKEKIVFLLNELDSLTMQLQVNEIDCCYEESIMFVHNKEIILLSHQAVKDSMYALSFLLKEAIEKQLFLHTSIKHDIGYVYNEYSHYICMENSMVKNTFSYETLDGTVMWAGMRYHLWAGNDLVSWIYNDIKGNIIFEITPFYPFMYPGAQEELHYISYEEWIQNYKSYFISILSKETAEQWLKKANDIVEQIDKNIIYWRVQEQKMSKNRV